MKILYKPFAIIASLIGARIAKSIFQALWSRIDDAQPPKATTEEASLAKVVGAAALEAATMAGVGAVIDRAGAATFRHLTGIWPGDREQKPAD
jgi:Protein of unknown function (DUF4235)